MIYTLRYKERLGPFNSRKWNVMTPQPYEKLVQKRSLVMLDFKGEYRFEVSKATYERVIEEDLKDLNGDSWHEPKIVNLEECNIINKR